MSNFLHVIEEMKRAEAFRQVLDAHGLAAAVSWLLTDDPARASMIAAAREYAAGQTQVLDEVTAALKLHLDRVAALSRPAAPDRSA